MTARPLSCELLEKREAPARGVSSRCGDLRLLVGCLVLRSGLEAPPLRGVDHAEDTPRIRYRLRCRRLPMRRLAIIWGVEAGQLRLTLLRCARNCTAGIHGLRRFVLRRLRPIAVVFRRALR